jgi:hypothetical protein
MSFLKGKTIRKGPPKQKLRADMVCLNVTVKITTGLIKVVFGNSLMQKH